MGSGRIRTGEREGPKVVRVLSPRSRMIDDVESGVVSELCLWSVGMGGRVGGKVGGYSGGCLSRYNTPPNCGGQI